MKSESERYSLSVRLPSEAIKRIEKSGEKPSDWLRQAMAKAREEPPKRPLPPPLPRTRL